MLLFCIIIIVHKHFRLVNERFFEHVVYDYIDPVQDVKSMITFLNALTGTTNPRWLKTPTLPPSTATTPKADPS